MARQKQPLRKSPITAFQFVLAARIGLGLTPDETIRAANRYLAIPGPSPFTIADVKRALEEIERHNITLEYLSPSDQELVKKQAKYLESLLRLG